MQNLDIRWKQRFQQFDKAYQLLLSGLAIPEPNPVERAGLIQFFEMAFELAWKLLKDYQESEGYAIQSPRDAIKQAFQNQILTDGHAWLQALQDRNLTTHTYNEETALAVEKKVRTDYAPLLEKLHASFSLRLNV